MLSERKAMYLRNVILRESVTRFGSKKLLSARNPYEEPLVVKGRKIIKVDMLECLKSLWGDSILESRSSIYKMVSGDCDDETWINLMCAYYKTHNGFSYYVTLLDALGPRDMSLPMKFANDIRCILNSYANIVDIETCSYGKSKLLVETDEYRWYSVPKLWESGILKGWCVVK